MNLLFAFLLALGFSAFANDPFPDHLLAAPGTDTAFDYVVVGGGTAGITIAARLAEHDYSVALVEAGGIYELESPTAKIPGADSLGVGSSIKSTTLVDWQFVTHKVPGAGYRDVHYPRGKCLGGSYAPIIAPTVVDGA